MFSLVILMALGSVIKPQESVPATLVRSTREANTIACGFLCRLQTSNIPSQTGGRLQSPDLLSAQLKETAIVRRSLPVNAQPDNQQEENTPHDAVKEAQKGMVFQHPSDGMWRLAGRGRKLKPNQDQTP